MTNHRYLLTAHNDKLTQTAGKSPLFFVRTYGCQMNERDSEKLSALLTTLGYEPAASQEEADFILYNTCCVRESAEDRVFGHISRLKPMKKDKPHLMIAIAGCMTQQPKIAEKIKAKYPYINIVFGTANRHKLPQLIWQAIETNEQVIDITGLEEDEELPELTDIPLTTREYPHKAGVNIMYGCNNYCSYCIVPYVRGKEKSRPMEDILEEINSLANDGVKEIMLLGQNVNSYAFGFTKLLRCVNDINGLQRIRFMTSHPKDFSDELITAVKILPKLCKSVHLPLQSGSTRILNDMNRMYTKEEYLTLAKKLTDAGIALSTDFIVAFPGETEEDFNHTLDVAKTARFSGAFTFIYSKRSGTPAAVRTDLIPKKTATDRFDKLTATLYPIMHEINQDKIGKTLLVMVEEIPTDEPKTYKGRADDHTLVHFTSQNAYKQGDIIDVIITDAKTFYIQGKEQGKEQTT